MANIKSQKKRNKQNEKRRLKNANIKSSIRTVIKKVVSLLSSAKEGKDVAALNENYKKLVKTVDVSAAKGIIHKKKAARKKSRLAKQINALSKSKA